MFGLDLTPLPPKVAIEQMVESRYGFSLVDLGIETQDLADFDQIAIDRNQNYNRCKEFDRLEDDLNFFLAEVGNNELEVVRKVASSINKIVHQILEASGKETAWICLRSYPSARADGLFRWHFDSIFYPWNKDSIQYRFVMTLTGLPTFFYFLDKEEKEVRMKIWKRRNDAKYVAGFLDSNLLFIPSREFGVVFMNKEHGALHSEPPIYEKGRLFLSIVPCSNKEIIEVERRVKEAFGLIKHAND